MKTTIYSLEWGPWIKIPSEVDFINLGSKKFCGCQSFLKFTVNVKKKCEQNLFS